MSASAAWGRPLTPKEWREFRAIVSLGVVITMPILMILPPRRFNGITFLQVGMLGWGVNEQVEYRTGRDLISRATGARKAVPVKNSAVTLETKNEPEPPPKEEAKAIAESGLKRTRAREG
jgi:hypothetical protein